MADINWQDTNQEQQASAAIAAVRKDGNDTDWMYITFAGTSGPSSQQLKVCSFS
jgi:hypothetical protein